LGSVTSFGKQAAFYPSFEVSWSTSAATHMNRWIEGGTVKRGMVIGAGPESPVRL